MVDDGVDSLKIVTRLGTYSRVRQLVDFGKAEFVEARRSCKYPNWCFLISERKKRLSLSLCFWTVLVTHQQSYIRRHKR